MATWTLILVFWGSGMATSTVGGFSSQETCNSAIEQIKVNPDAKIMLSSASCVKVK